ncbi:thioredoxin reductase [Salinigranum rubrum]|uniref:Thioredoxin reductase n=1 Tax=Salinigranum rubrum TaxID=755307 RepID=A0A2I8VHJ4_9EURY|nr:FAD-binding protein [Salinigranum rubrum]AUV81398.1 thioredoxin reductase [Salinigranum rubrum]
MNASDSDSGARDVLVVGGGVAGLTAATFTARAGLDTLVLNGGESILRRNAHLENVPGCPAGVNPRLFAGLLEEQAARNGVAVAPGRVVRVDPRDSGFVVTTAAGDAYEARYVVAASWSDASYLPDDVSCRTAGSKTYVDEDGVGRISVAGLYAAGRLSEQYHQAVVAAGHGAAVGITLLHDSGTPFYNDWVTPDGYFTERGREVPPGCEEIDAAEQARRQAESRELMRDRFANPHPQTQRTHPSLVDDERGRVDESWEVGDD